MVFNRYIIISLLPYRCKLFNNSCHINLVCSVRTPYFGGEMWFYTIMHNFKTMTSTLKNISGNSFEVLYCQLVFSPFLHQTLPPGCDPVVTVLAQSVECPTWWRHQMETISALLALCEVNSPVIGEFPSQRQVTRSFGVFFDLRLNKRLSKQSWGWWLDAIVPIMTSL